MWSVITICVKMAYFPTLAQWLWRKSTVHWGGLNGGANQAMVGCLDD